MITSLSWSPDGLHIASGSSDGTLHIWHALSLHHLGTFVERRTHDTLSLPVTALSWSPDGALLAEVATGILRIWDISGHLQRMIELPPQRKTMTAITWVRDETGGKYAVLVASDDGTIQHCSLTNAACSDTHREHTCTSSIQAITWLAEQQQGQLVYVEESTTHPLLHLQQFSLCEYA